MWNTKQFSCKVKIFILDNAQLNNSDLKKSISNKTIHLYSNINDCIYYITKYKEMKCSYSIGFLKKCDNISIKVFLKQLDPNLKIVEYSSENELKSMLNIKEELCTA